MQRELLAADKADRAKAAAAVAVIHMMLGVLLLTGLAMHKDRHPDTSLATFDVAPLPPPPEERVERPAPSPPAPAGFTPTAIAAPPSVVPISTPAPAVPFAGPSSGTAASGAGSGAGGAGNGVGAGGTGGAMTGARLISGSLDRRDYRQIADLGPSLGAAELLLLVNTSGAVERCRVMQSSGNPQTDAMLCQLLTSRATFAPAHDASGALYYQDVHYFPHWGR